MTCHGRPCIARGDCKLPREARKKPPESRDARVRRFFSRRERERGYLERDTLARDSLPRFSEIMQIHKGACNGFRGTGVFVFSGGGMRRETIRERMRSGDGD